MSLLLTTHHLEEAEARCSRTVIIDHGRVIAAGTLPELVDQTVGRHRLVTLRLDAPLAPTSAPAAADSTSTRRTRLVARAADRRRRGAAAAARAHPRRRPGVEDVEVRGPSLQAVFIHLTGRELRE